MSARDPLRVAVRRELLGAARRARGPVLAASLAACWLAGAVGAGAAVPRYEQAALPSLAGFDLGFDSSPAAGDLDGDGDADLVAGARYGELRFLRNTGSSTGPAFVVMTGSADPFAGTGELAFRTPALADLDGDGDLDVVAGRGFGTLAFLENTGTPTAPSFVEATGTADPFAGIDVGSYSRPALVDLDGDGDLDAAVGEVLGNVHYLRNTGSPSAPAFVELTGTANPLSPVVVAGYFSSPSLADLDGDGDPDAVVGSDLSTLAYFRNTRSSTAPAFVAVTGTANPFAGLGVSFEADPTLVDLDGDADLDVVVGEYFGTLRYLANTGASTAPAFAGGASTSNPLTGIDVGLYSVPALADLDGDGDTDALVLQFPDTLRYFRNTGSATAASYEEVPSTQNPFLCSSGGVDCASAMVDLDGDDDLDMVQGDSDGTVRYQRNTGSATAPAYAEMTGTANPFAGIDVGNSSAPALADLDGDLDPDLAVGGSLDGLLRYFRNTGSAIAPAYAAVPGTANPFAGIAVGTRSTPVLLDADGDLDVDGVVGGSQGGLQFLHNTGSATAPAYLEATGAGDPFAGFNAGFRSAAALADLDGDGDVDVVVGEDGGALSYLRSPAAVFADGFESGDTAAWSLTVP